MNDSDFTAFTADLTLVGEAMGEPISPARFNVYFDDLHDFDLPVVQAALRQCRRTLRFFPKPAEIRAVIEGDPETRATMAWTRFQQAIAHVGPDSPVTFGDPALHAAVEAFGGWRDVNLWTALSVEQQGYLGLQFRKVYQHYLAHPVPAPEILNAEAQAIGNPLRRLNALGLPLGRPAKALAPAEQPKFDPVEGVGTLQRLGKQVGGAMARLAADPGRRAAVRALGVGDMPLDVEPTEAEQAEHVRRQQAALSRAGF